MSLTDAIDGHLSKLPALDAEDLKAVRSSVPGKVLGRTAGLLSLVLLAFGFAGSVDFSLKRLLDVDLSPTPWLRFGLLLGLPLLAVGSQLIVEWRGERNRRALQQLAVRLGAEQSGYFRIGPYLNTTEDRARFNRADRAHEKVLNWLERSASIPLYLTGDSGSGKSSLLNASVLPALRGRGWTVVEIRAWQDPRTALRDALLELTVTRRARQPEKPTLRDLIELAARRAGIGLLLVLDQFEEFVILGDLEQKKEFAALLTDLRTIPIRGLILLLVLRSDYQTFLEDIGDPSLRYGENLYQVGRFTFAAASDFLARSGLELQPSAIDRLLASAAELDETPSLVRPITLNVIGYVLAAGKSMAASLDAGHLVRQYIEQTVGQPAIRDLARRVLEQLVTEQGTKRPQSEQDLVALTRLRRGEVRAVLNGLGNAALARPLDPAQGVWELSHDFVARAVARHLGRGRHRLLQRGAFFAAPALLLSMLLISVVVILSNHFLPYQTRSELADLGFTAIKQKDGGWIFTNKPAVPPTRENFARAGPLLAKIPIRSVDLSGLDFENPEPLSGLVELRSLDLTDTKVGYFLDPLQHLDKLQKLRLSGTQIGELGPLRVLTELQSLDLSRTKVYDLEPLRSLKKLRSLYLSETNVWDLHPLEALAALRLLDLGRTEMSDLQPIHSLIALESLRVTGTQVKDVKSLEGLAALQSLDLDDTKVQNLEPLIHLVKLRCLYLSAPVPDELVLQFNRSRAEAHLQQVDIRRAPSQESCVSRGQ